MFVIVLEIGLVLYQSVGVRSVGVRSVGVRSVGVRTVNGSTHFTHFSAGRHTTLFRKFSRFLRTDLLPRK